jgi:hypothetical protein
VAEENVSFPSPEVWTVLEKLVPGSWVRVGWHDASSFSRVRVITPEIYVTRKKTAGYFYGCKKDPDGDMIYMILYNEETDGVPSEGTSIPLGCVEEVITEFQPPSLPAPKKIPRKTRKHQAPIKIIEIVEKILYSTDN